MPDEKTTERTVEIAGLPGRILAALIDYLFVSVLFVLFSRVMPNPDYAFIPGLLSGLIYFTVVHSELARGQSLGKRLFGLRVVKRNDSRLFLSQIEAAARYLGFIGIVLLVREAPPVYFRKFGVVGDPGLLDLPMLLALVYLFGNFVCLALDPLHRSLHDRIAGSVVLRGETDDAALVSRFRSMLDGRESSRLRSPVVLSATGALIGAALWVLGLGSDPEITAISTRRYKLEHELPFRLVSLSASRDQIELEGLAISDRPLPQLAEEIARFLKNEGVIGHNRPKLHLVFYEDPAHLPEDAQTNRSAFFVDAQTLSVTKDTTSEPTSLPEGKPD